MNDELQQRLAANEDVVRRVNEAIDRGRWPGESDSPIGFRCECAQVGCNMLLALTPRDYARVRSGPRRFVMLRGHELPAVERVVETLGEIVIVEKLGAAGSEAAARDPRDSRSASRRAR
ncbi:MAG: hypothetical protein WAL63_10365 [Solirubrobacteraceae bacterium]